MGHLRFGQLSPTLCHLGEQGVNRFQFRDSSRAVYGNFVTTSLRIAIDVAHTTTSRKLPSFPSQRMSPLQGKLHSKNFIAGQVIHNGRCTLRSRVFTTCQVLEHSPQNRPNPAGPSVTPASRELH